MDPTLADRPHAQLAAMADALGELRDPRARHWLVLPGRGRGEWLQRRWARRCGVASRSQVVNIRSLLELVAAGSERRRPFDGEALALAIAERAHALPSDTPFPVPPADAAVDGRTLDQARQIADAIDMALLCRQPEERFAGTPWLASFAEDAAVVDRLANHLGTLDAATFEERIVEWRADWERRGGLPHLWIGLDVGLPTILADRLAQLLRGLPSTHVHLHVLSPSPVYWGDQRLGRRAAEDPETSAGPVLDAFGRRAQDLHNQLIDHLLGEGSPVEIDSAPTADHLLARLQTSCASAAPPAADADGTPADDSLSVHACRSPLRELEVCRDRILQAMAEDETLRPEDCLLLLADAPRYAPLVAAAWQPQHDPAAHIPFRLVGGGVRPPASLATGLVATLDALTGRCDQAALLGLLEHPLVARRYRLADDRHDGATLLGWLHDAGFRWGLDAEHRREVQGVDDDRWHLRFALRRLVLGAMVAPEERAGIVAGDVPLDRASGLDDVMLARLARLVDDLATLRPAWRSGAATVDEWCDRCRQLVETLFAPGGPDDQERRAALLDRELPALRERATVDGTFTREAFRRLLDRILDDLATTSGGGDGGATVGPLVEFAGTPARLVLVCGLGEGDFPRYDERPAWHPLAAGRRWGDPQRRDDDRHALLLALLAAEDRLVLTYLGGSEVGAEERPPSTPLADLIGAAGALCGGSFPVHRHPLNGFSPAAHDVAERPVGARGRLPGDHRGALALLSAGGGPAWGLWRRALAEEVDADAPIDLDDLVRLLKNPVMLHLRHLGLAIAEEEEAPEGRDRLALDGLEQWRLRSRLIERQLATGSSRDREAVWQRAGELPPGAYGATTWADLHASLPNLPDGDLRPVTATATVSVRDRHGRPRTIELVAPDGWHLGGDGAAHCLSASKKKSGCELLPFHLAFQVVAHLCEVAAGTVHFAAGKDLPLVRASADTFRDLLGRLVDLHDCARLLPLPWWPSVHEAMAESLKGLRKRDPAASPDDTEVARSLATAANRAFHKSPFGSDASAPAERIATRLAFRSCADPTAWDGPSDVPALAVLPLGDAPLTLRLFAAIDAIAVGFEAPMAGVQA